MEAYTYSNIFDTKGIEYIVIIFFLLLLIPFWIIVNRKSETVQQMKQAIKTLTATVLNIPRGLFYSPNHAWLYLEKNGQVRIGIDDFLVKVLGEIEVKLLKNEGEKIKKGDVIAVVEQNGKQLKLHSPVSGQIAGINADILEDAATLLADPYGKGWMFTVEPDNWKAETVGFLMGNEVKPWVDRELRRLKDFLNVSFSRHTDPSMAVVFQEGGELQMNPLTELDAEVWDDFQNEFME
ncbi:glycine cleavage system protein H [Maribellus mangrovi]|uniref:glycine cleavage system protein H n=1 Tax=Maribellus mangrovi TaxID=3133146 RepID=UPI0030EE1138